MVKLVKISIEKETIDDIMMVIEYLIRLCTFCFLYHCANIINAYTIETCYNVYSSFGWTWDTLPFIFLCFTRDSLVDNMRK